MVNTLTTPGLQSPPVLTGDYMLLPIEAGFDWAECFAAIETGEWYLVAFRCKHRDNADEALLTRLDSEAAAAARGIAGFLFYFAGTPRETGDCLSFCLWDKRPNAQAGSMHAAHQQAMEQGVKFYVYYTLERYRVRKDAGGVSFLRL
jgi:hypothetical protein